MTLSIGHRSYPSGNVFLHFAFGSGQVNEAKHGYKPNDEAKNWPKHAIILPNSASRRVFLDEMTDFVLVKLKPGMAAPFLNLSLSELQSWENADDIWSSAETEQLATLEAVSIRERVQIIERVLLQCLAKSPISIDQTIKQALNLMQNRRGSLEIRSLADQLHISGRQLRRKFQHHIGLTPKQYNNIVRFRYANRLIQQHPEMTLTEVAHQSGYFDLAHFTHAIQEITGITPSEMARIDQQAIHTNRHTIDVISLHAC